MPGEIRWSQVPKAASAALTRQRDEQQKANCDDEAEGTHAVHHECREGGVGWIGFYPPDRVEGRLKLEERGCRRQHQRDAPDNGRDMPGASLTRALEQALHRAGALTSDQVIDLADDLSSHCLRPKGQTGNGGGDEQDGRNGEERVVGERRTKPRDVILPRRAKRAPEHSEERRDGHSRMGHSVCQSTEESACLLGRSVPWCARAPSM